GFNYIGGNGNDNEAIIYFRMASKSNSNEIAMILEDATNQGASVFIWNPGAATFGNQWTVTTTMGASSILGESIGIAYETSSGAAVAFAGNGPNSANWVRWNPGTSSWSAPASQDTDFPATLTNNVRFVIMKSDPVSTSNKIMITVVDDNSRISTRQIDAGTWSGANWVVHTAGSPSIVTRAVDFAWDPSGSTGAIFYETSGIADITITRNTWTGSSAAWGISATLSVASSIHYWITAATNPTDADTTNILFTKLNSVFDIGSVKYNGTTFTLVGEQSLTADTTVTTYEGHSIAFKLKPEPSFTEQLGVVEQIKIAVVKPIAKQQLGVVEQIKIAVVKPIAKQQLGLQENIAIKISKPLMEQMALTAKSSMSVSKSLTEQLGLTENHGRSTTASRTFFDQLAISEKISVAVSKSMLEQLSIQIVVRPSIAAITEPLSLSDTVTKTVSKPMAESLAIA